MVGERIEVRGEMEVRRGMDQRRLEVTGRVELRRGIEAGKDGGQRRDGGWEEMESRGMIAAPSQGGSRAGLDLAGAP